MRIRSLTCVVLVFAASALPASVRRSPPVEAARFHEAVLIDCQTSDGKRIGHGCGVLIGPAHVLTVAHAVTGFTTWTVTAPNAKGGSISCAAKDVWVHAEHKPGTFENDIAILHLHGEIAPGSLPRLNDGDLWPLDTKLVGLGRVTNGRLSPDRLFEANALLSQFPNNLNLYGGQPSFSEAGDSGAPVYLAEGERTVVGLVLGRMEMSRANVTTDAYLPLSRRFSAWIRGRMSP